MYFILIRGMYKLYFLYCIKNTKATQTHTHMIFYYVQVDLGTTHNVQAVATQGYSATYDLATYYLDCSLDGNKFTRVKLVNGTAEV